MPKRPLKPCRHSWCPNLTADRYCSEHAKDYQRPSAQERGYNARWRKRSKLFLKEHPLCDECLKQNKLTPATVVDHIVPHRGDPILIGLNQTGNLCAKGAMTARPESMTGLFHIPTN